MKDAQPKTILLNEYSAPDFLIEQTHLTFDLGEVSTEVVSKLKIRRNQGVSSSTPLVLDGVEQC